MALAQPGGDLRPGDGGAGEQLAAGEDGRGQPLGVGGGEDDVAARWRLLEGLEDAVGRLLGEAVGAADDGGTASSGVGTEGEEVLQARPALG